MPRRDRLAGALADKLVRHVDFIVPPGGSRYGRGCGRGLMPERWSHEARRLGLAVTPGLSQCIDLARAPQAFRLDFAGLDELEIGRAVEMLAQSKP